MPPTPRQQRAKSARQDQPQQPQPAGRQIDLEAVVNQQALLIGNLQSQLIMANLGLANAEAELATLKGAAPSAQGD